MKNEIDGELKNITYMVERLYQNQLLEILETLNIHFEIICKIMLDFIRNSDEYTTLGFQIPKDVLLCQVKNFITSYEKKDPLMLADVLKYEISESLMFYREILTGMGTDYAK